MTPSGNDHLVRIGTGNMKKEKLKQAALDAEIQREPNTVVGLHLGQRNQSAHSEIF
jgi:hypothetical protein